MLRRNKSSRFRHVFLFAIAAIVFVVVHDVLKEVGFPDIHWAILGALFYSEIIVDHVLTKLVMDYNKKGQKANEMNPVAAFLFKRYGHLRSSIILISVASLVVVPAWIMFANVYIRIAISCSYLIVVANGALCYFALRHADRRDRSQS